MISFALGAALGLALGLPPGAGAQELPVRTAQPAQVARALDLVTAGREQAIDSWMEICRIPALPKQEGARARVFARLLIEAGLTARILPSGNVEARWAGTELGPAAVISAHLDALHAPSADNPVRRVRETLVGPGVLDDGSGLAALLLAVRALHDAGWHPRRDVLVVATVGEEIGLVGAKSYLADRPQLVAFVSVDGILGRVDYGATGIRWTRWTLHGPGGHTLLAGQVPSPVYAAARAISALADFADKNDALLNVSDLHAPGPPNAVPSEASFTVDLRSDDAAGLAKLNAQAETIVRNAASGEGVEVSREILQDLPAVNLPGSEGSRLVVAAADILRRVGVPPQVSPRGSSDHDVALMQGIPAIAVGATAGRDAHAPTETAELGPFVKGAQQVALLIVLLGEDLGPEAASAE